MDDTTCPWSGHGWTLDQPGMFEGKGEMEGIKIPSYITVLPAGYGGPKRGLKYRIYLKGS